MKRFVSILITSLLIVGALTAGVSAASFNDLTSYQKQKFWQMWEKDCYQLLVDQKYSEYFTCSTGTLEKASKLVEKAAAWCKDSDGGMDYYNKGVVTTDVYPNGIEDYFYTFSNGKSYLLEGACSSDNRYMYYQKSCKEIGPNYTEGDGVCKKVEVIPHAELTLMTKNLTQGGAWYDGKVAVVGSKSGNGSFEYHFNLKYEDITLKSVTFKRLNGPTNGADSDFGTSSLTLAYNLGAKTPYSKEIATAQIVNDNVTFSGLNIIVPKDTKDWNQNSGTFALSILSDISPVAQSGNTSKFILTEMEVVGVSSGAKISKKFNTTGDAYLLIRKSAMVPWVVNKTRKLTPGEITLFDFTIKAEDAPLAVKKLTFDVNLMDNSPSGDLSLSDVSLVDGNFDSTVYKMLSPKDSQTPVSHCSDGGTNDNFADGEYEKNKTIVCVFENELVIGKEQTLSFNLKGTVFGPAMGDVISVAVKTPNEKYTSKSVNAYLAKDVSGGVVKLSDSFSGKSLIDTPHIWSDLNQKTHSDKLGASSKDWSHGHSGHADSYVKQLLVY